MAGQPPFAVHISLTVSTKSVYLDLAERLLLVWYLSPHMWRASRSPISFLPLLETSACRCVRLPLGSTSGASVEVSSWSGNPLMCCLCCSTLESIGSVQRPTLIPSPLGKPTRRIGSPSHGDTLTTNTHLPRSRRLFLGGCLLLLSLVVGASHCSLESVTSAQRASPVSPLGRGNMIR